MGYYLFRRCLQMLPVLFGVVLISFVLFHVVGGSPAVMALGKNATPAALEEFDETRGFNRPLLCGRWTTTRAWPAWAARHGAVGSGPWEGTTGARKDASGAVIFAPGVRVVPLACPLRADTDYRWRLEVRQPSGGTLAVMTEGGALAAAVPVLSRWTEVALPFAVGAGRGNGLRVTVTGEAPLEIRAARMQRRMTHLYDSQLTHYLSQVVRLDFGVSLATNERVAEMLKQGVGPSLLLTVPIFFGGLIVSIALALICTWRRDSWLDRLTVVTAVVLMSVNYLVWIVAGQYLLAYHAGWFPIWGFDSWRCLLLPVLIGLVSGLGANLRFYRTVMLEEINRDYVRTALAKGLGTPTVLFRHVLRNAMIPIITSTVIAIPFLYTGSLLLESFFGIPGLGGLSINAINSADVDVIRGVVLVGAVLYMLANLLTDICYAWADPRIRLR